MTVAKEATPFTRSFRRTSLHERNGDDQEQPRAYHTRDDPAGQVPTSRGAGVRASAQYGEQICTWSAASQTSAPTRLQTGPLPRPGAPLGRSRPSLQL